MFRWVQYLTYIISFFIPPAGLISFWVFSGRDDEQKNIAKWCMLAAFIGFIVWAICCVLGMTFFGRCGGWR